MRRRLLSLLGRDQIEHDDVVGLDGPVVDRDELRLVVSEPLELGVDELGGYLRLGRGDLERRPIRQLRLRRDRNGGAKGECAATIRQFVPLHLGPRDRAHARLLGGVPEPAVDVAADGLGRKRFLSHPGCDDGKRHLLAGAEAGDPHVRGHVGGRVLDGVVHRVLGNLDLEADLALLQLLDLRLHGATIQTHGHRATTPWRLSSRRHGAGRRCDGRGLTVARLRGRGFGPSLRGLRPCTSAGPVAPGPQMPALGKC